MGYNTVAFLLNDLMGELKKSPKTVLHLLTCPPMSEEDKKRRHAYMQKAYDDEPGVHFQALEVLPTFHADEQHFFVAGENSITEIRPLRYGVTKEGKKTVTLELPDWFEPRWYAMPRGGRRLPRNWPKKG